MGKRRYEAALIREYDRGFALGAIQALFHLDYDRDSAREHLEYVDACTGLGAEDMDWALEGVYGPAGGTDASHFTIHLCSSRETDDEGEGEV
jgi:hypothetical protein